MFKLGSYCVECAIETVPEERGQEFVSDLQEELKTRPHLRHPRVAWNQDLHRITVAVEWGDFSPQQASAYVSEELFEITAGVFTDVALASVEVLTVSALA